MLTTTAKLFASTLLAIAAAGVSAHGNVKCTTQPKSEWKAAEELAQKLTKEGWQIRRMEVTKSCYEVYAKDPQGNRIEAFFNPVTLERVEEK